MSIFLTVKVIAITLRGETWYTLRFLQALDVCREIQLPEDLLPQGVKLGDEIQLTFVETEK